MKNVGDGGRHTSIRIFGGKDAGATWKTPFYSSWTALQLCIRDQSRALDGSNVMNATTNSCECK